MMGIIYDTMRQNFNEEEEEQASLYEDHNLISFCDFIDLLALHTDDDSKMVCEYLINEDTFLKLDICTFELADNNSSETRLEIVSHKYDAYLEYKRPTINDENEHEYPTKNFLEDFLLENGTKDYDLFYFWKIDDLLDLDCMANIGLNENSFGLCLSAMKGNARIILELNKQNKELMASLNELYANAENNELDENNELESVKNELADVKAQNAKLIADIEENKTTGSFPMGTPTVALTAANARIKQLEQDINRLNDQLNEQADKPLRHNSEMSVAKMLYGILKEHNYDLSATKGKANSLIENASQLHGTPVTRNFIAKWIELSNQAKSDSTK